MIVIIWAPALRKKRTFQNKRLYNKELRQFINTSKEMKISYDANDRHYCSELRTRDKKIAQFDNGILF